MASDVLVKNEATVPTNGTTGANGSAIYIGDLDPSSVVLSLVGSYTATMQYQVSFDGTNYFQCGGDVAGTGAVADATNMTTASSNARASAVWCRLHCSAYTSIASLKFTVTGKPIAL